MFQAEEKLLSIFIVNQVAGPLMVELIEQMVADGWQCTLMTGEVQGTLPSEVLVHYGKRLVKDNAVGRMWSWLLFTIQAIIQAIRYRKILMLIVTNPPFTMLVMPMLKRLLGIRYVLLIYDIYPDVLERMGIIVDDGWIGRFWRRLSGAAMVSASRIITLGDLMSRTLQKHLHQNHKVGIEVVPTWVDTQFIRPLDRDENVFAKTYSLGEKLVVMYSGSFGATHDIDSILKAAEIMQADSEVHFILIGGGTQFMQVSANVECLHLSNLTLMTFRPRHLLPLSLAAADCAIVCLDAAYAGISIPSKTYYAMAAGSCLLAISPPNSELAKIVEIYKCGLVVPPRQPAQLVATIQKLKKDRTLLQTMKWNARSTAEGQFDRQMQVKRFVHLLRSVADAN